MISDYQLMCVSLSRSLRSSWIMDAWYVRCALVWVKKKSFGTGKKPARFRNQSCSVVMESWADASHALPPRLWFEQHPILRFHHTAPPLSICMSTSTVISSCTPQATSTSFSLHPSISHKVLFQWNGGYFFNQLITTAIWVIQRCG